MEQILTKRRNYELCASGAYGNRVRQWNSIEEWRASGWMEPVAMRVALPGGGGGPSKFGVLPEQVELVAYDWMHAGIPRECIKINEMADALRILQGEYRNDIVEIDGQVHNGVFYYTRETHPMPIALRKSSATTFGLRATLMIQQAMTPSSYADWQVLLERYPSHVLEVSIWENCIGDIPGRNAIVWEIRRY